jgi:predicted PhzF superfamily epimerase YddE/YHI9
VDVYVVDAFTERPFGGNPAGVVLLTEPREPEWMQQVAAELKHAETAFAELVGGERAGAPMPLRWFTPTNEVDLCGHATLACAHVLGGDIRFATRSGVLGCTAVGDGWVHMDFPADPPTVREAPESLAGAVGQLPVSEIANVAEGTADLLVELESEQAVRELRPDIAALAELPYRGVIFTAAARTTGIDFVSRCFYPSQGIDEDPVTGSAHCTLACWWGDRLGIADLVGEQASTRGGRVRVNRRGDRVALSGRAVTVLSGRLHA